MKTTISFILVLLFFTFNTKGSTTDTWSITEINSFIMKSKAVNDSFKIFVSLPNSYDSVVSLKYPVVYYLDGNKLKYHTIMKEYAQQKLMPEVISVRIGYIAQSKRERDYTYDFTNFYNFLENELIPFVDKTFRTDVLNRTLTGHSYGGLCTLQALFKIDNPKNLLFRNFIPTSPSIWWNGRIVLNQEVSFYSSNKILPVNLYVTMGSNEGSSMVPDFNDFSEIIKNRNYRYLNFENDLNIGYDHSSNGEISFREGIQWVFKKNVIHPDSIILNTYSRNKPNYNVDIYPNPAKDFITINSNISNKQGCIDLFSFSGTRITTQVVNQFPTTLDIRELRSGLYLLRIYIEGKNISHTIIIE